MNNIAEIGFRADTSDLASAVPVLKSIPPAVQAAEKAADDLAGSLGAVDAAARGVSTSAGNASKAITATNNNLSRSVSTIDKVTASYKKLSDMQNRINNATGVSSANDNIGRAADIDAYGKSLDALRAKYSPLFAASQAYKAELNDINSALKVGAINEKEHADAIMNTKVAFVQQVNGIRGVNDNLESFNAKAKNAGKAAGGLSNDAKNLSYQLVDVTQGLLSGQPVFQIFAQQAGQIGQVIATSPQGLGGLMKELGSRVAAILTPVRLLALGIVALGAALLYAVTSTIASSKALDDLSKSIDVSTTKLHGLQQAASFKGISTEDFSAGMKSFADSVYDAQRNMGTLRGLMVANNMNAKDFAGYLSNVADLVEKTNSGLQKRKILEAAGLPTTEQWVRFMSQGSKGIQDAINETVQFNAAAEANLVQKARDFDDAWNKATTKFVQYFKSGVVDLMDWVDKLSQKTLIAIAAVAGVIAVALAPFSLILTGLTALIAAAAAAKAAMGGDPAASGRPRVQITGGTTEPKPSNAGPQPKTQAELLAANQQAQQRISILGDLATVEQQVTLKQLELNAASLNSVGPNAEQAKAIINLTRATAENNKVQQQAAIGVFNLDQANKAAADTLQSWIDKKLLDPTNAQQMAAAQAVLAKNIRDTADAAAVAASKLPQLKQLELDSNNLAKVIDTAAVGAVNNLSSALGDIFNGTVKVGQGFKNMGVIILQALQQAIIKLMIIGPLMKGLGGLFGGIGLPFGLGGVSSGGGTGFSLTGTGGLYAKGGVFANDNVKKFANGGMFTNSIVRSPTYFANGGTLGVMGEAGPEAIMPLKRGADGSLGVQMHGGSRGGGAPQINYAPSYTLGGSATKEDIENLKKADAENQAKFVSRVANANSELSRRNYKGRNGR